MLVVGIPFPAGQILLRAMMADVGDEERLVSGEDRAGMLFALLTLTNKVGTALSTVVLLPLAWVGFNEAEKATNTPFALNALTFLFVALPILVLLASSAIIRVSSMACCASSIQWWRSRLAPASPGRA